MLQEILDLAKSKNCKIHFPIDYRGAMEMKEGSNVKLFDFDDDIPDDWEIFDMGPKTAQKFDEVISKAGSIFWNGPMGVFEIKDFRQGSVDVLNSIIKRT